MVDATLKFFNQDKDIKEINKTFITLIPKTSNLKNATQYRPISLYNVIYKIIAKTLENRFKIVLNEIISPNQGTFIKGRQIIDNIMIMLELLQHMKINKNTIKDMALKLDMSKAYERVEWDYLKTTLRKKGFSDKWVKWIMKCIYSVTYQILINGSPMDKIEQKRGIRQGDPLSPMLFLICMEGFSSKLRKIEFNNKIEGIRIRRTSPMITHLLFADNCYIFTKIRNRDEENIKNFQTEFSKTSGQVINLENLDIIFSNNAPT